MASPPARAESFNRSAFTNFDRATPASASVYITVQSTSSDQSVNLTRIGGILGPKFAAAINGAAGGGSGSSSGAASITAVVGRFKTVFNGEYRITALLGSGKSASQANALIGLGLQPGMNAQGLQASLALLGMTAKPKGTYHGIALLSVDLGALAGAAGGLTGGAAGGVPSSGASSSSAYLGVLGNDAVVGTSLPSLKSAIDAYTGSAPS